MGSLSPRVLITGSLGFCGQHLAQMYLTMGAVVYGFDIVPDSAARGQRGWFVRQGDLRDRNGLLAVLNECRPDLVFHLAGLLPGQTMQALFDANVLGTVNLLEAICDVGCDPLVLVTSSSAVYGLAEDHENPLAESQPFRPTNHYAVSKITQEMVAYRYYLDKGLRVIRARAFNIIGPGQPDTLACSSLARQVAEVEAGLREPEIHVGNLHPVRDYVDVRDVVNAYRLLLRNGMPGEVYNVCSSEGVTVERCLAILQEASRVVFAVKADVIHVSPADVQYQVGDNARIKAATGWRCEYSLRRSLTDLLDYWRDYLGQSMSVSGTAMEG